MGALKRVFPANIGQWGRAGMASCGVWMMTSLGVAEGAGNWFEPHDLASGFNVGCWMSEIRMQEEW